MPNKSIKRACPTPEKKKFGSHAEAEAAIQRGREVGDIAFKAHRAYFCKNGCRRWHTTSTPNRDATRRFLP